WASGRTSWPSTGSPPATRGLMRYVGRLRRRPAPEACAIITAPPARKPRSTTARGRWSAPPRPEVPPHAALPLHPRLQPQECPPPHLPLEHAALGLTPPDAPLSVSGGAPTLVILDNLREGVLAPDIYDPALNPLYRRVLAHYGVTAL